MKRTNKEIFTFRLRPDMDAWLKARAEEEGIESKSLMLRMILAKEMKQAKRPR